MLAESAPKSRPKGNVVKAFDFPNLFWDPLNYGACNPGDADPPAGGQQDASLQVLNFGIIQFTLEIKQTFKA